MQVLSRDNVNYGYNAATDKYEDLVAAGIIDPSKVKPFSLHFFEFYLLLLLSLF